jgi:hypothetical protein
LLGFLCVLFIFSSLRFLLLRYCINSIKLLAICCFFLCCLCDQYVDLSSFIAGYVFMFSIFSCHHRTMLRVCGCHQGCAGCAFGSWSDPVMQIVHDQCEVVFRDCGHDHIMWMIVCCCQCGQTFCFVGIEDRSVLFLFG